jgi:hypothetical protein
MISKMTPLLVNPGSASLTVSCSFSALRRVAGERREQLRGDDPPKR